MLALYLAASALFTYLWAIVDAVGWVLLTAGLMSFFALGAWAALYAYTPETYPTRLRASGMGAASGYARIAAALAPLVGGLLTAISLGLTLSVFAASFLIGSIVVALLGTETRDRPLPDSLAELEARPRRRSRLAGSRAGRRRRDRHERLRALGSRRLASVPQAAASGVGVASWFRRQRSARSRRRP